MNVSRSCRILVLSLSELQHPASTITSNLENYASMKDARYQHGEVESALLMEPSENYASMKDVRDKHASEVVSAVLTFKIHFSFARTLTMRKVSSLNQSERFVLCIESSSRRQTWTCFQGSICQWVQSFLPKIPAQRTLGPGPLSIAGGSLPGSESASRDWI